MISSIDLLRYQENSVNSKVIKFTYHFYYLFGYDLYEGSLPPSWRNPLYYFFVRARKNWYKNLLVGSREKITKTFIVFHVTKNKGNINWLRTLIQVEWKLTAPKCFRRRFWTDLGGKKPNCTWTQYSCCNLKITKSQAFTARKGPFMYLQNRSKT